MDPLRYFTAVMLIFAIPLALVYWLTIHPFIATWRRLGMKTTFAVVGGVLLATALGIHRLSDELLAVDWGTNWPLAILGGIFLAGAIRLRRSLATLLPLRVLVGIPELAADKERGRLITDGIYAQVRHPRYLQLDLAILGYALIANFPAGYGSLAVWLIGSRIVVLFEERELICRFGEDYCDYCRRVPRYIPRCGKGDRA